MKKLSYIIPILAFMLVFTTGLEAKKGKGGGHHHKGGGGCKEKHVHHHHHHHCRSHGCGFGGGYWGGCGPYYGGSISAGGAFYGPPYYCRPYYCDPYYAPYYRGYPYDRPCGLQFNVWVR